MSPAAMACEAKWTACWLEPHILLRVTAGTVTGKPASMTASRPTLAPCSPAWVTVPFTTSSIFSTSIPVRSTRPLRVWASRASGRTSRKAPSLRANGVRTASRMTGWGMGTLLRSTVYDGQCNMARLLRVVEDPLAGNLRARRMGVALAGVQVASPTGEGARGDLHPHPVPGEEGDPGHPQVHGVLVWASGLYLARLHRLYHARGWIALPGAGADNAVRYDEGPTIGVDVHEPGDEVRVGGGRGGEEGHVDAPEDRAALL